jgi:cyclopropane fatty-acyl-phospholipid synthase-like methyltransferase
MTDVFKDKAADWDVQPIPVQISEGVFQALSRTVKLSPAHTVMDFGAGTGLACTKLAPHVSKILAVDVSAAMLAQLAKKSELSGKLEIFCQDILQEPLGRRVDLVVSAMAMHHVENTQTLLNTLFAHLVPGGQVALADLDCEKGDFHPPEVPGIYHTGFDRDEFAQKLTHAGFANIKFVTACEIQKEGKPYPIFLVTATKPL